MSDSIFRKESMKKVSSPEVLNEYLRVSNPGVWLIIGAVAALLIGTLVWAAVGSLESTVSAAGVAKNGEIRCYMADAANVKPGCPVTINEHTGTVTEVLPSPLTAEQAAADSGADDYTVWRLNLSEWNFVVVVDAPDVPDGYVQTKISIEKIRPSSFMFS